MTSQIYVVVVVVVVVVVTPTVVRGTSVAGSTACDASSIITVGNFNDLINPPPCVAPTACISISFAAPTQVDTTTSALANMLITARSSASSRSRRAAWSSRTDRPLPKTRRRRRS